MNTPNSRLFGIKPFLRYAGSSAYDAAMSPANWRAKAAPWMYLVLAIGFAVNAAIWALLALHEGMLGFRAVGAVIYTMGAAATGGLAYYYWGRKASR